MSAMNARDTIYSLSSGGLPSGVAVIRVSGPAAGEAGKALCGSLPAPRRASLKTIAGPGGDILDQGLVLFFPGPESFTGEDCLELQVHGGRAVVQSILETLGSLPGLRHAEAGEFSRRAFRNGKLDLLEVEGLADLLAAETDAQRQLASMHACGGLSEVYRSWAERLIHARAMIEAELDFADEDDVPASVSATIWTDIADLRAELEAHLDNGRVGAIIRDGYRVVIAGPPNAGKSSLLNALAQQDIAIVTHIAGTTRDVLSVDISLAGFAVKLYDTAGLRVTKDPIEREGIRRAHSAIADADLILSLSESPHGFLEIPADPGRVVRVGSKIDISAESWDRTEVDVVISTRQAGGLESLLNMVESRLPALAPGQTLAIPSRRRHTDQLRRCLEALDAALRRDVGLDLLAEDLRQASNALGRITGAVDVEDLLDVIFSEFCIGK